MMNEVWVLMEYGKSPDGNYEDLVAICSSKQAAKDICTYDIKEWREDNQTIGIIDQTEGFMYIDCVKVFAVPLNQLITHEFNVHKPR